MKIAVIGGGVSGTIFAIRRTMNHPEDEIVIFEHLDKILKKILATGNGKCNIANKLAEKNQLHSPLVKDILFQYDYDAQNAFLDSLGIKTKLIGDLSYPISESAVTVRNQLLKAIDKYNIKVVSSILINDYSFKENKVLLSTNQGEFIFDKVVIATGGKSSPKLGSDGSIIPILNRHGYQLKEFVPALCPLYTKEKTKILDGTRVKANVKLLKNGNLVFEENGEVLFKEKGLSGIVIFNASRVIAQELNAQYIFSLDLIPSTTQKEVDDFFKNHSKEELLEAYLHPNLVKYLSSNSNINIKDIRFTFDKLYGFDNSQVSVGGITFNDVNELLESKKEKGIHFLGELLDYTGPCGGYNLMWAIASALHLADKIKK